MQAAGMGTAGALTARTLSSPIPSAAIPGMPCFIVATVFCPMSHYIFKRTCAATTWGNPSSAPHSTLTGALAACMQVQEAEAALQPGPQQGRGQQGQAGQQAAADAAVQG